MKSIISLLIFAILLGLGQATTVIVSNYCGQSFNLWESGNNGGGYSKQVASLSPQQSVTLNYGTGAEFNLKAGQNGKTLAEFKINSWSGLDFYDVSRVVGYDYPIMIQQPSDNGRPECVRGMCKDPNCHGPDAYGWWNDDSATHACSTGKTFKVLFCGF